MARVHGKGTYIAVAGANISPHCKTSEFKGGADKHDTTGYGVDDHDYEGGLRDATFTAGGVYDSSLSTGPRAIIDPLRGTRTAVIRRTEGTGVGKPQQSFTALVEGYTETNPVDGMIAWAADFQVCGLVISSTQ